MHIRMYTVGCKFIWNDLTLPVPKIWRQTTRIAMMFTLDSTTATAVVKMKNRGFSGFFSPDS